MTAYDIQFRLSEAGTGTGNQAAGIGTDYRQAGKRTGSRKARRGADNQKGHRDAGYREGWKSKAGYHLLLQSEGKGDVSMPPEIGRGIVPNLQFIATVKAPATSICLTRESGLKPLMKYEFGVRSRNAECEGKWSTVSKYIGMFIR